MVNKSAIVVSEELLGISDALLQKRLKNEFGFPCGPITSTTKTIYIKKLQEFINASEKTVNAKSETLPSIAATTTSGRSTPVKSVTPSATPKTRRKTLAAPANVSDTEPNEIVVPKPKRRASTGRASPTRNKTKSTKQDIIPASISNFSDSEVDDIASTDNKPNVLLNGQTALEYSRGSRLLRRSFSNRASSATSTQSAVSPKITNTLSTRVEEKSSKLKRSDSSSSTDSEKKYGGSGHIIPRITSTAIGTRTSNLFNFSDSENEETNNANDKKESKSITETITKRLLRHRPAKSPIANSTTKKPVVNASKDNYFTPKYSTNRPNIVSQVSPSTEATQLNPESYTTQSNWISYGILICVIVFFVFIFSFYFYSRYSSALTTSAEEAELNALEREFDVNIYDLKIPDSLRNKSTGLCSVARIRPVLMIIEEIKQTIDQNLSRYYCESSENEHLNPYDRAIIIQPIKSQIESSIGKKLVELDRQSRSMSASQSNPKDLFLNLFTSSMELLSQNTKWHLKPIIGLNGAFTKINIEPTYPKNLRITCQLKLFVIKTFWYFFTLIALSVVSCLIYYYVMYVESKTLKEKKLLFELVEKSIELLQSPDEPQSLPILHIRDMLLNPQQRKQTFYQNIWEQVVQFIENNESRIISSLVNIDGEDYRTWKWVATINNQPDSTATKTSSTNQLNHDYNPFSENDTTTNSIRTTSTEKTSRAINTSTPIKNSNTTSGSQLKDFVALTCFLKVRNLIDSEIRLSDENWKVAIRNRIIANCCKQASNGKTHGLQHINVDDRNVNDCLVYIKCDSIETASNAFKALNGTKFSDAEAKGANVKFLKEERYYNRFPDAKYCTTYLQIENV